MKLQKIRSFDGVVPLIRQRLKGSGLVMRRFICRNILLFLFGLLSWALPPSLYSQDLGNVGLRTVQQKVFSAQSTPAVTPNNSTFPCTPTNGSPCAFQNLGQTAHILTYTTNGACTTLDVRFEGSQDGVNFFSISPDATDTPQNAIAGSTNAGGVSAVGTYAVVHVNLVAISGCTLSAFYSGTFATTPTNSQITQQATPVRVVVTQNTVTSNAFSTITIATPFGNSQGSIWLQCSAACASGGVVSVFASPADSGIGSRQIVSAAVGTVATLQRFDVPAYLTNRVLVGLTPTGASANTWTIYYNFSTVPQPAPALSFTDGNLLNANAGTSKFGVVACENFAPINTTASLQLLSSGGLAQNFYICSFQIVVSIADNVALVEGTGATCGTSTAGVFGGATAATGWNLPANGQVSIGSGLGMIGKTTVAGNNLCLLVSSAAQISGGFTWTQF